VDILVLGAKTSIALVLILAAGAKLADPVAFSATVRLFIPHSDRFPRATSKVIAVAIAIIELVLGATSLSLPNITWLNYAVLVLTCGFVGVSLVGYIFYNGWSCRCFGALSQRKFDVFGIFRSALIACIAGLATLKVSSASTSIGAPGVLLLFAGAAMVVISAFTAARVLAVTQSRLGL
jgi:hypothetical protein